MEESNNLSIKSGTNELELLEFSVISPKGETVHLGLNVAKVREIIKTVTIRSLPESHKSVLGVFELRGNNIQALDIRHYLYSISSEKLIYIIMEFSRMRIAVAVDSVSKISRVKWSKIKNYESIDSNTSNNLKNNISGIYFDGEKHIYILDYEQIVADVRQIGILNIDKEIKKSESGGLILTAEDSTFLRNNISNHLSAAGFEVKDFSNGLKAYHSMLEMIENGETLPNLIVTDVEMPEMDGYTLTKKIKEHPDLSSVPVILFSSIITDEVLHKGESVGADRQLSKPNLNRLVNLIEELI